MSRHLCTIPRQYSQLSQTIFSRKNAADINYLQWALLVRKDKVAVPAQFSKNCWEFVGESSSRWLDCYSTDWFWLLTYRMQRLLVLVSISKQVQRNLASSSKKTTQEPYRERTMQTILKFKFAKHHMTKILGAGTQISQKSSWTKLWLPILRLHFLSITRRIVFPPTWGNKSDTPRCF